MGYSDSESDYEADTYLSGSSDEEYSLEAEKYSELVLTKLYFNNDFMLECWLVCWHCNCLECCI